MNHHELEPSKGQFLIYQVEERTRTLDGFLTINNRDFDLAIQQVDSLPNK